MMIIDMPLPKLINDFPDERHKTCTHVWSTLLSRLKQRTSLLEVDMFIRVEN
jgi:hypothetical protein